MSIVKMLAVLVVAIFISAACSGGGGGGGEVTIEEYFRLTDELSRTKARQQAEFQLEDYPGFNLEVDDTRAIFEAFARIEDEYESGLRGVQPPDELRAMHSELLDSAEERLDGLDAVVEVLSDAGPSANVVDLLLPLGTPFLLLESEPPEACRALNDFAAANDVSYGDPCARLFRVEGASMSPTVENGDLLDVYPYHNDKPHRGDMVVFNPPTSPNREFLKRIIGMPGDEIVIDEADGDVTVNGVLLDEAYIRGTTNCLSACEDDIPVAGSQDSFDTCGSSECYFVMGDNRQNSSDSRQGWLVPAENINGWVTAP